MSSGKKRKKRGSVGKKILYLFTSLLGVIVILMSCAYGAFYHYYSRMNIVRSGEDFEYVSGADLIQDDEFDKDTMSAEDLKQLEEIDQEYKPGNINYDFSDTSITNIMIVGTDSRERGRYRSNSDAMVLVSINKKTKKLFITSFMRDIFVDVPAGGNHKNAGKAKLNSAFGYRRLRITLE